MSALAHAAHFAERRTLTIHQPGPLRRLVDRYLQWRQRRVEQDIAVRFGLTNGYITDEIERRISERLLHNGGFRG